MIREDHCTICENLLDKNYQLLIINGEENTACISCVFKIYNKIHRQTTIKCTMCGEIIDIIWSNMIWCGIQNVSQDRLYDMNLYACKKCTNNIINDVKLDSILKGKL